MLPRFQLAISLLTRLSTAALAAMVIGGCVFDRTMAPERPSPDPVDLGIPGYPGMPKDNPLTRQGIDLGRKLFFDPILSEGNTQACASCHQPARAFSDTLFRSRGVKGLPGSRNASSLINVGWQPDFFWDGRAATLELQALEPVPNPLEMNLPWDEAVRKLSAHPEYPALFAAAFGEADGGITREKTAKALAQFQRTLVSMNSRYDRFLRGEAELTPQESSGLALFNQEKTGCSNCHSGILFTDFKFHNNGLTSEIDNTGRGAVTGNADEDGMFRTPSLRNAILTLPLMHDGRFSSLEEVMEHYSSGGYPSRTVNPLVPGRTEFPLSEGEIQDVIAFLKTLTDSSVIIFPY